MSRVLIYTSGLCGYCYRAKRLLQQKGVVFEEVDVTFSPKKRAEMARRSGGSTAVPQIWINDRHIGGSDELYALEAQGQLDALLENA